MIIETKLENNLVARHSDKGVKIRKVGTQEVYDDAIDLTNERRVALGLEPYEYEETDEPIEVKDVQIEQPVEQVEENNVEVVDIYCN